MYVWIPEGVDTRLMNQYVTALRTMLTMYEGPDELGILQLCEELDEDPDMYSAVWAHLDCWMRTKVKDIRDDHRRQTGERIEIPRHDGRAMRRSKG